jgi:hypothetical protein
LAAVAVQRRCRQRQRGAMSSYVNKGGDVGAMMSSL